MRQSRKRERIIARLQLALASPIVSQFQGAVVDSRPASSETIAERGWIPISGFICKYGITCHRDAISFISAGVIDVDAFWKANLFFRLKLYVNEDIFLLAGFEPNLHERIDNDIALLNFARDQVQLFIQKLRFATPVDLLIRLDIDKPQKVFQTLPEIDFPGTIEIILDLPDTLTRQIDLPVVLLKCTLKSDFAPFASRLIATLQKLDEIPAIIDVCSDRRSVFNRSYPLLQNRRRRGGQMRGADVALNVACFELIADELNSGAIRSRLDAQIPAGSVDFERIGSMSMHPRNVDDPDSAIGKRDDRNHAIIDLVGVAEVGHLRDD